MGFDQRKNYPLLKSHAIRLRKSGQSYREIRDAINVSKSTLSYWLKNIRLKQKHKERLYTKQVEILSRGSQSQKQRRKREVDEIIKKAEKEIRLPLSLAAYRLAGAFLYWAEGSKGKRFSLTNSDPHLILFVIRWIESIIKIPARNLKARLNIYPQQNEKEIKKFWSDVTGIPLNNFGKSYVKPFSKGYKKNNLYYGTIRVEIPKSTDIQYRIFGWIKCVLKKIDPEIKIKEHRWISLRKVSRPVNLPKETRP
jgi:hypothetical protein